VRTVLNFRVPYNSEYFFTGRGNIASLLDAAFYSQLGGDRNVGLWKVIKS
jgi:hypothetical protein